MLRSGQTCPQNKRTSPHAQVGYAIPEYAENCQFLITVRVFNEDWGRPGQLGQSQSLACTWAVFYKPMADVKGA